MKYLRILIKDPDGFRDGWVNLNDFKIGDEPDMERVEKLAAEEVEANKERHPEWKVKWKIVEKKK